MTAAFTELDAGIRDAETAVHAADARLHAIERAAHQLLLQHRRAAALQAQEEARAAEERKHELRAREAVLQQELKDLAEHLRRAGHEISRAVAVAAEQGRRGRVRKDVSLTSGATRDAVPRTWPIRLSEWQRLWDGARAVGADYVEITLDLDSGLATDLVRPNELPGFVVQINAQHIGEIQR
jgi:hypothetical protein